MRGEDFIQFYWKHSFFPGKVLTCTCGANMELLSPGEQNFHAGPDFFNLRIRMNQLVWAGNMEVHRKASDWYRHAHHRDPSYNNVILHVVGKPDAETYNSLGRRIPILVPEYPASLIRRYQALKNNVEWIPCAPFLQDASPAKLRAWLGLLGDQRIGEKSMKLLGLPPFRPLDMESAFYQALAAGFGLALNSLPFELLSKGIPLRVLWPFRERLEDLEALLFGYSGLLYPARNLGPYPASLWERFRELRQLLTGEPLPGHLWKFHRLRPVSFPTLRIAQFASILHQRMPLLEHILSCSSLGELEQTLQAPASSYWDNHYLFGKCSAPFPKYLGQDRVYSLIINVVLPFCLALKKADPGLQVRLRATEILQEMKAEKNRIIHQWKRHGIRAQNAMESQALLQLFNVYCKQKRCLFCQIGTGILEASFYETQ